MPSSDTKDSSEKRALDCEKGILIVSCGCEFQKNIVTLRRTPYFRSSFTIPSYMELIFGAKVADSNNNMYLGTCNHALVDNSSRESFSESSSAYYQTPSQSSYVNSQPISSTAAKSTHQDPLPNSTVEKFLIQEYMRNYRLPVSCHGFGDSVSQNILALDLSSTRTSMKRLLEDGRTLNDVEDQLAPYENIGIPNITQSFSNISYKRRKPNVLRLRKPSSQSVSWHSGYNPQKQNRDCHFLRIVLGKDVDWVRDAQGNISSILNNSSEMDTEFESHGDETIQQDFRKQPMNAGYLQRIVNAASRFLLRWNSGEKHDQAAPVSITDSSLSSEMLSNLSSRISPETDIDFDSNDDARQNTSNDLQITSQSQQPLFESLEKTKESQGGQTGGTGFLGVLRKRLQIWNIMTARTQERDSSFRELAMARTTLLGIKSKMLSDIQVNAVSPLKNGELTGGHDNEFKRGREQEEPESELFNKFIGKEQALRQQAPEHSHQKTDLRDENQFGFSDRKSCKGRSLRKLRRRGNIHKRNGVNDGRKQQKPLHLHSNKIKIKTVRSKKENSYVVKKKADDKEEEYGEKVKERKGTFDAMGKVDDAVDAEEIDKVAKQEDEEEEKEEESDDDLSSLKEVTESTSSRSTTVSYSATKREDVNMRKWKSNLAAWKLRKQNLSPGRQEEYTSERKPVKQLKAGRENFKDKRNAGDGDTRRIKSADVNAEGKTMEHVNKCNKTHDHTRSENKSLAYLAPFINNKQKLPSVNKKDLEKVTQCEEKNAEGDSSRKRDWIQINWRKIASEIRRPSSLMKYRLQPPIDACTEVELPTSKEESQEKSKLASMSRFPVSRKSFFVKEDTDFDNQVAQKRNEKWLQEKYKAGDEGHKLSVSGQTGGDDGEHKEVETKRQEVLRKIDDIAKEYESRGHGDSTLSAELWIALLETLVKANETIGNDRKKKPETTGNRHERKTKMKSNRRENKTEIKHLGRVRVRDYDVSNGQVEVSESRKRRDFNLNKEILDWIEDSSNILVSKEDTKSQKHKREKTVRNISKAKKNDTEIDAEIPPNCACSFEDKLLSETLCEIKRNSKVLGLEVTTKKGIECEYQAGYLEAEECLSVDFESNERDKRFEQLVLNKRNREMKSLQNSLNLCSSGGVCNFRQKDEIDRMVKEDFTSVDEIHVSSSVKDNDRGVNKVETVCARRRGGNRESKVKGHQNECLCVEGNAAIQRKKPENEFELTSDTKANIDENNTVIARGDAGGDAALKSGVTEDADDVSKGKLSKDASSLTSGVIEDTDDASKGKLSKDASSFIDGELQETNTAVRESQDTLDSKTNPQSQEEEYIGSLEESYGFDSLEPVMAGVEEVEEAKVADEGLEDRSNQVVERSVDVGLDESERQNDVDVSGVSGLYPAGVVDSAHVYFLRQRIIEELQKFSERNVRPVVGVPDKRHLLQPPEFKPVSVSRKTLDQVGAFLGVDLSAWLALGADSQICSSSEGTPELESDKDAQATLQRELSRQSDHLRTEADHDKPLGDATTHAEDQIVENCRELTFYEPLLPIPAHYKCSCADCCRLSRRRRSHKLRSRRTLLSSDNFGCKNKRCKSQSPNRYSQDAWARSDLERTSPIKPHKRIYANRFFRKRISMKNILKMCSRNPKWFETTASDQKETIIPDSGKGIKHEKPCRAVCLNSGDFETHPKAVIKHIPSLTACQSLSPETHMHSVIPVERICPTTCMPQYDFESLCHHGQPPHESDTSCKSDLRNIIYDHCKAIDYLDQTHAYTRSVPYVVSSSPMPVGSSRKPCSYSPAMAFLDRCSMANLYRSPRYTSTNACRLPATYRPQSITNLLHKYLSTETFSTGIPCLAGHEYRSHPSGLTYESYYKMPHSTRWSFSYPAIHWPSTSCLGTYRSYRPRTNSSMKSCSGCHRSSVNHYMHCPSNLTFSMHNYV